jgi:hypothetical protein
MKTRTGFVSNSSTQSFIIERSCLVEGQALQILNIVSDWDIIIISLDRAKGIGRYSRYDMQARLLEIGVPTVIWCSRGWWGTRISRLSNNGQDWTETVINDVDILRGIRRDFQELEQEVPQPMMWADEDMQIIHKIDWQKEGF